MAKFVRFTDEHAAATANISVDCDASPRDCCSTGSYVILFIAVTIIANLDTVTVVMATWRVINHRDAATAGGKSLTTMIYVFTVIANEHGTNRSIRIFTTR